SYVVGDQATDIELAARIGARGILIQDQQPAPASGLALKSLWEAANWIVEDLSGYK
ncbi:MAG: HAD hydrolase-like protein, partial [Candidatus Binatia bacterium]